MFVMTGGGCRLLAIDVILQLNLIFRLSLPRMTLAVWNFPSVLATATTGQVYGLLAIYSVLIAGASYLGGAIPGRVQLTHARMQHILSLVGGLMLGIAVFHLSPHAMQLLGPKGADRAALGIMYGILVMFFLLRAFHFHQHEAPAVVPGHPPHDHDHDHDHSGDTHHHHDHHAHHRPHEMGWMGVFLGLGLHTLIDGAALGASLQGDAAHATAFGLFGLGTFAAILLHKPLDAVSITSLMVAAGWSRRWQLLINVLFSLLCPLGAVLFLVGTGASGGSDVLTGTALAFSAGVFLCISLSDLLPEMEFHSHHRLSLSGMLLLGVALAWMLRFLEPGHAH